jgi:hypothetical protein
MRGDVSLCKVRCLRSAVVDLRRASIGIGATLGTEPSFRRAGSAVRRIRREHLAHGIYPAGIEGRRKFDRKKRHRLGDRSQSYLSHVPRNDSRCCRDVRGLLGRQHLARRCDRGDTCRDVHCRTEEVARSAQYRTVVEAGPRQWNSWLGSAGRKQTPEHLKSGSRIRKTKHRFVADPLDRRPMFSERLAHQFLEAFEHRYCGCVSVDICYRTEARQIDERNGRDSRLEAVDSAQARLH